MIETKWHSISIVEALKKADSTEKGLSLEEANRRFITYGPNILPEEKTPGLFYNFLSQFFSPLIIILIIASIIVLFMGEFVDGVIILFVIFFNAIVGTVQEGRAQNTLKALKNYIEGSATVIRDNKISIIPDKEVVVGDIIILQEGEKVPADARLIITNSLKADESSLTGESIPVEKNADEVYFENVQILDKRNMVWKGTNVASGYAHGVVVATGISTEIGKISKSITSIDEDVPLRKNIANLSKIIIAAVFVIGLIVFFLGISHGDSAREMFAIVVSMSVSIIPEGLPIVMTIVLASGVWRMTQRNVLVKKLQAVEALGQVNVIAVDKTGTLTKNEMVLEKVYVDSKMYSIGGLGYEPKGEISLDNLVIDPLNHPDLLMAGRVASFCVNAKAVYIEESKKWKVSGDPTEVAMGVFAQKIGFNNSKSESEKIFEIPFDYITKYHLNIHKFEDKNFLTAVGAPEQVLNLCDRVWRKQKSEKLLKEEKDEIEKIFLEMSNQGYRMLAIAIDTNSKEVVHIDELSHLTFIGFYGLKDPIREEVHNSILQANSAGIRVVMITGDHKITASAIAKEAGILHEGDEVILGEELDKLSDAELLDRFDKVSVFARVTPSHKLKIIELFKKKGDIVAMTGDGVNDAPSLADADLGVAMGGIGTEVAKEASDIILLDDNFGNIILAVEEGRSIYKTIKKVVLYLFSTSIGEVLAIIGSIFLGFPLIVLPSQIIWLNFVTDGFLDVSLGMEPKEDGLLKHRVKHSKYILDWSSSRRMIFMGLIIAFGSLFIFSRYLNFELDKALTVSMTTLAVFQWFNAWNCKSENQSIFSVNPFKNMYLVEATLLVIILQLLAIYTPFMQSILHTVPLNLYDWLAVISTAASIIFLEEIRKLFYRNGQKNK
ncbi:MAG: HAD-IC family P-type ATPase [Patescibacteria group bacterium]|nr:HAD-IC family P-type ATPase [Patescibacteria group bacterium]